MPIRAHVLRLAGLILLSGLLLPVCSCRHVNPYHNEPEFSEFVPVASDGWDSRDAVCFDPIGLDSIGRPLTMILSVRYSGRRALTPLRLAVECDDERGVHVNDTITLPLFNADGSPKGRGRYGVYEVSDTLLRNFSPGFGLGVSVTPLDGKEATRGILNVGLIVTSD